MINGNKKIYLCDPANNILTELNGLVTDSVSYSNKAKDYQTLTCEVDRYILINGEQIVSSGYDNISVYMQLYLDGIGYFQIQQPEETNDGSREYKSITAYSCEKEFEDKDILSFQVNTGEDGSLERLNKDNLDDLGFPKEYVTFYRSNDSGKTDYSLLHYFLEQMPGWSVRDEDIDRSLWDKKATFDEENTNLYALLTSVVAPKFECIITFDILHRRIGAIAKEHLDSSSTEVTNPDGSTSTITYNNDFDTSIFIGFRNLANSVQVTVDEDSIFTQFTCSGGGDDGDLTFEDVNFGQKKIIDLSYFMSEPYMRQETVEKLKAWQTWCDESRDKYIDLSKQWAALKDKDSELNYRVPSDMDYWKQWSEMDSDLLTQNLKYYQTLLESLQQSVDSRPDSEKFTGSGDDKTYNPVTKSDGTVDHDYYLDLLKQGAADFGGYYTYKEIITYVLPNIQIAIDNKGKVESEQKDYVKTYETDWSLYGITELQNKKKTYEDVIATLGEYALPFEEATTDKGEPEYTKKYSEYWNAKNNLETLEPVLEKLLEEQKDLQSQIDEVISKRQEYEKQYLFVTTDSSGNKTYNWDLTESEYILVTTLIHNTDYTNSNIIVTSVDDTLARIEHEKELLDDSINKLSEVSQPQYKFSVDLDNLLRIPEFQHWVPDLQLYKFIRLGIRDDYSVKLRIIGITYNPCEITPDLTLEFSNMITSSSGRSDLTDILSSENNRGSKNSISLGASTNYDVDFATTLLQTMMKTGLFRNSISNVVGDLNITGEAIIDSAKIKQLFTGYVEAGEIKVGYISGEEAEFKKFFSNFTNIDAAFIKDGTIQAAKIGSINADTIKSGTLETERLILVGKDGKKSIIEAINEANGAPVGQVNNSKIQAVSIDIIDLSALNAKIAGFDMSENSIYSKLNSVTGLTGETYWSTNRFFLGDGAIDADKNTPFQAYADGSFKLIGKNSLFDFDTKTGNLNMEVSSLKIASKSVATSDDIDDALSEKTTVLKIESSNGAPLKDGVTTTTLSVVIYNGRNRITNIEDLHKVRSSDAHLEWCYKKNDESDYINIPSDDTRISNEGFLFVPTQQDILNRYSFKCKLVSNDTGYVSPDQETAIDRVVSRLQDYVDETLLPSVKNNITSEISKDVYVGQIEQNKEDIAKLQDEVANSDIRRGKQRQVGKACLWYHNFYEYGKTDEEAAAVIAQNDIVVAGGTLYSGKCSETDRDRQIAIIQKAKKLNPNLKIFYYITIASWRKDGDWSHILGKGGYWDEEEASKHSGAVRIHTKWEIFQLLEYACHVGGTKNGKKEFIETYTWTDDEGIEHTEDKYIDLYEGGIALDGCFYDDAGMETEEGRINQGFPAVLREKYIQLVDYTHGKGLLAFPNQMSQDWYADTVSAANPNGLPSAIGENDYMLLESCHSQVGFSGRPLWRHVNNTTNVWNYYQNWYPKVGAKVVVNDYLYGTHTGEKLSDEEFYELATYLVCDTLCSGAHYIDMNGLRTWDLPDFFDELLISDDTEYDITREAAGHYILHANGHTLEVIRGTDLSQGETVSLKTLNKVYIYFDDIRIKNGFKKIPQYAYETDQRLDAVEDELEKIQTSAKSTASIYHRMMIDDWASKYIYTNFATTAEFISSIVTKAETGIASVDSVDYDTNSLRLKRLTNAQIVQYLTIDISNKKGHTFEFGWTVNEVTNVNNWGFNTESPVMLGWTTIRPAMNNTQKSSLYGKNFYGYVKTVTIPEDTEEDTWRFRIVYNGAAGEVFDFSNFYAIDVDEYSEDITKEWYTNLIPTLAGAVNNNNLTICYKLEKLGDYDFKITWNDPDNYANWSGLRWNIPSGSFVPGHTYEFGCETYEHNAGNANVAFRLYYPGDNKWIPVTLKIKSSIYGDERPGYIFTVPESATATDGYINFTNTSGKYQNSAGDYIQATVKGMYLYDVNEENIAIRGEEPSNSYMQICRVSKEKLEKDKKLIGNAVYIVDNGTMFVTDFNGNRTDIASSSSISSIKQDFGLAWLGWSNNIERGNGIENDAVMFSKHDIVGMQRLNLNSLASSKPTFTENTIKILKRAKELNPKLRTFEYIQSESGRTDFTYEGDHAHLNSDGSWEGSTADLSGSTRIYTYQQICDWLDWFKESGTDGVFFDDWGYDFAKEDICYQFQWDPDEFETKNDALNKKWIMLIEACHKRGLFLITNGGLPMSVGDWYTYLDENDIICLESCMISSDGNTWQMGQKNLYDYYANWYATGKCKAKIWSQNYFPSDAELYKEEVLTYLCAMTYACGGNYVSMGTFKCIEMPEFMNLFSDGDTKTIKKIDDNTYQLKINNHVLEVHQWKNLSGRVSEKTVNKNYYILDGKRFNNGFLNSSTVDYELTESVNQVSEKLNSMSEDSRKNAISYWRMAIDDWNSDLSFLDYTNLIAIDSEANNIANGTIQTVNNSDGSLDIVCTYNQLSQGGIHLKVIQPSNYEDFNQTGAGLEFGFSDVIFDMSEDSWTLPNGTVYEAAWLWSTPSFYVYVNSTPLDGTAVADYKIEGVGSELGSPTGHYIKSQQKTYTSYNIRVWFHAPEGQYFNGTVTIKNAYLIDLGEHEDEISKKWYTNIFPGSFNTTSAMTSQRTLAEKNGWKVYDFSVSHTNAWGWTKYKYTGDELQALRGHTIELGCTSMVFSNGETGIGSASNGWVNYAFGIGVNTDNPNTVRLYADIVSKSQVWNNEKLCCLQYTIPDDATSLVIGFQSFGFSTDVTATIKGVYLYDLGEEVSIRGKSPTNASLQLCRVTESQEALTPSNMRNALYVTEKGRIYCYDMSGVKTDIAGSVYIGATNAGYTGTPEEFGAELYQLIQSSKAVD